MCTRSRAASERGSQHGDLRHLLGRAVPVLDQPADVEQASQRPPRSDEVPVDVCAVAGDDVAEALLVSEREGREVESASPRAASDQSTTPVTSSPATKTWSTWRSPWMNTGVQGRSAVSAIRRLRVTTSVGRTPFVISHSHSLSRFEAISSRLRPRHGGSGASCNIRAAAPAAAHAADDAVDGSPRRPSAAPGRAASASTGGFRHRTSGVGMGAIAIASISTSVRV